MMLTEEQNAAIKSLEPVSALLEQIALYRELGQYHFAQAFPEDYAKWVAVADLLQKSDEQELRRFGIAMKRYVDAMALLDSTPPNTYWFRRRVAAFGTASEKISVLSDALSKKVVV